MRKVEKYDKQINTIGYVASSYLEISMEEGRPLGDGAGPVPFPPADDLKEFVGWAAPALFGLYTNKNEMKLQLQTGIHLHGH